MNTEQRKGTILENVLNARMMDEQTKSIQLECMVVELQEENKKLKEDLAAMEASMEK